MTALVTGAGGFVGRWLVAELEANGEQVWTLGRPPATDPRRLPADVRDAGAVRRAVDTCRPDRVYHLAGVASNREAASDPAAAIAVNAGGTANVLEACRALPEPPVVLVAGSGEVYGGSTDERLLDEESVPQPMNLYAASKLAQETVALTYWRAHRLPVVVTRTFNLIGPGQSPTYALPSFALQLAAIELGRQPAVLRVGNLAARRDFTDVRDAVRAYRLLAEGRHVGAAFNVASGRALTLADLLDRLVAVSGVSVSVEVDPDRLRPVDPRLAIGDPARLARATGWSPIIPLERTLADVWSDARRRAGAGVT